MFFNIYGNGGHLGHVIKATSCILGNLNMKFGQEMMFENVARQRMDRQMTDKWRSESLVYN